jgi:antitoxin component YwqK of YwqJK toxin-antitoxin module
MKSILILLAALFPYNILLSQQIGFPEDKFGIHISFDDLGGLKSSHYPSKDFPGRGDNKILFENRPYTGIIFENFDVYQNNIPIRNGCFLLVINGYRRCLINYENNFVESVKLYDLDGKITKLHRRYYYSQDAKRDTGIKISVDDVFKTEDDVFQELTNSSNFVNLMSTGALFYEEINETNGGLVYKINNQNLRIKGLKTTYHSNGRLNSIVIFPINRIPFDEIIIQKYNENQIPLIIDTNFTFIKSNQGYNYKISRTKFIRDEYNGRYYTTELKKQVNNDYYFKTINYSKEGEIINEYTEVWNFDPTTGKERYYYDGEYIEHDLFGKKTTITSYSAEKSKIKDQNKKNGEQIKYFIYPDKIESRSVFENDLLVGNAIVYYSNGKIKSDLNYIIINNESLQNGEQKEYFENGVLKLKQNYYNGKLISFEKYNSDGSILQKGNY